MVFDRMVLITILVGVILLLNLVPPPADKIVVQNVGQGDSILIQHGTTQILTDGGEGMVVLQRLAEELPWFDRTIEVLILTHPQRDHLEGLVHVLERYKVNLVLLPRAAADSGLAEAWLQKLIDQHIPYRFSLAGEELKIDDLRLRVLNPFDSDESRAIIKQNLNNASTITRLDWRGLSVLLTGDSERPAEALMMENYISPPAGGGARGGGSILDVDILKLGHHGSKTSTSQAFLAAVTPKLAVISVGAHNKFGHPTPITLQTLKSQNIPVVRTDQSGSISLLNINNQWLLSCARKSCIN